MDADETPVVNDLLERLRARVEERRASGAYPPGLEHDLDVHFRHIVEHRPVRNLDALHKAMAAFEEGLRFDVAMIPTGSRVPGGQVLHQAAAPADQGKTTPVLLSSGVRTPRVPWPGTDGIGMFIPGIFICVCGDALG